MNFLILTPDGVGSTILQRLLTMTFSLENVNAVNTHELTNRILLEDNIAVHDKRFIGSRWKQMYAQSLPEIESIIRQSSKDTNIISRVAKYHLDNRSEHLGESKELVTNFYKFLNAVYDKKIMCVRNNIFEYALSWSIRERSGILNVYDRDDKKKVFGIKSVQEDFFLKKCQQYIDYTYWIKDNFPDTIEISYEDMITNTDAVLEQLTGFKNTYKNSFKLELSKILKIEYETFNALMTNKKLTKYTNKELGALVQYKRYTKKLVDENKIMNQPIKNTTLYDKRRQIKNFNNCLRKFESFAKNHNWIDTSNATYDFWHDKKL